MFTRHPDITGLVVHNEAILGPLLSELGRRGKQVPSDISVLAVCPEDMAEAHSMPLTSIAIPTAELGSLAVEMAMRQLDSNAVQSETRLLSPRLTERGSTGPVVS
jgi:DNA-binding LacI/PurR family transcriptional regulator